MTVKGVKGATAPTGKVRIARQGQEVQDGDAKLSRRIAAKAPAARAPEGVSYLGNASYTKRGFVKASIKVTK